MAAVFWAVAGRVCLVLDWPLVVAAVVVASGVVAAAEVVASVAVGAVAPGPVGRVANTADPGTAVVRAVVGVLATVVLAPAVRAVVVVADGVVAEGFVEAPIVVVGAGVVLIVVGAVVGVVNTQEQASQPSALVVHTATESGLQRHTAAVHTARRDLPVVCATSLVGSGDNERRVVSDQ